MELCPLQGQCMSLFQRILFPFDFSEPAKGLAAPVAAMARRFEASVDILSCFHFAPDYVVAPRFQEREAGRPAAIPYTPEVQELRRQQAQELDRFAGAALAGIHWTARVEDGDPAQAIEWVVRHEKTDLIMMPTRGVGRFRRLLLGSVTAKVLHDVECPVWTSVHGADDGMPAPTGYRSILCAVSMGWASEATLRMAGRFARAWGAQLCLLHIDSLRQSESERSAVDSLRRAYEEAMGTEVPGELPRMRILDAPVPEGIRHVAVEEGADLLIIGRGHFRGDLARAWSHVYEVIRESACPVLSV